MKEKKILKNNKNYSSDETENIDTIDGHILKECSDREFEKLVKVLVELETKSGSSNFTNMWKEFRKHTQIKSDLFQQV